MSFLADLFPTPYYTVVFASERSGKDQAAYEKVAGQIMALAMTQEGYLGVESLSADGRSITVSYWRDEAAIKAWRLHPEHEAAIAKGRKTWYSDFRLRVACVERAYGLGGTES